MLWWRRTNMTRSVGWRQAPIAVALFSLLSLAASASAQQTNNFPASGWAGVGVVAPRSMFHLYGPTPILTIEGANNQGAGVFAKNTAQQWYFGFLDNVGSTGWSLYDVTAGREVRSVSPGTGSVGIGIANPAAMFHVAGNAQIDGNIAAKYQDVAEWVRTRSALLPGTVVAVDTLDSDGVVASDTPYDTRVAGVVSPRPGVVLGEPGQDKVMVAHSGRVRVRVDAGYGSISRGDLLVASPTPGYAMRSEPMNIGGVAVHRPGTLVGKALEPLSEGQGEILVLLMLQ